MGCFPAVWGVSLEGTVKPSGLSSWRLSATAPPKFTSNPKIPVRPQSSGLRSQTCVTGRGHPTPTCLKCTGDVGLPGLCTPPVMLSDEPPSGSGVWLRAWVSFGLLLQSLFYSFHVLQKFLPWPVVFSPLVYRSGNSHGYPSKVDPLSETREENRFGDVL